MGYQDDLALMLPDQEDSSSANSNSPTAQALLIAQLQQQAADAADRRKQAQDELKLRLENSTPHTDLTSLAALSDMFTGGKLQQASAHQAEANQEPQGQIEALSKELRTMPKGQVNTPGLLQKLSSGDANLDVKKARLGMFEDTVAARAADKFDNDPINKQSITQVQKLTQAAHTLDDPTILKTPQVINEVQRDINIAIAQGGSLAAGQEVKGEFQTMQQDYANFLQRISSEPKEVQAPLLRDYLRSLTTRLGKTYGNNIEKRANAIAQGRNYENTPAAKETVKQKLDEYKADRYAIPPPITPTSSTKAPAASDIMNLDVGAELERRKKKQ